MEKGISPSVQAPQGAPRPFANRKIPKGERGAVELPLQGLRRLIASEATLVLFVVLLFLLANAATATRYPYVDVDEVSYTDPAASLYLGHGFTSGSWYAQPYNAFWAGNVPLHAVLLYLWMRAFGFSILSVRTINYFYAAAACLLIWRASIRLRLVMSARWRFALLLLIMTCWSIVMAYRSGRPDSLTMLLAAGAFYGFSLRHRAVRLALLAAIGFAAPWAGLQLLPFFVISGVLLLVMLRRSAFGPVIALNLGTALGVASLVVFYDFHHVLGAFSESIAPHLAAGLVGLSDGGFTSQARETPKDPSFIVLVVAALLFALYLFRQGKLEVKSPLAYGLIFAVVLTSALVLFGKFPTYYGWMTFIPLAVGLCGGLSTLEGRSALLTATRTLLVVAGLVGVLPHVFIAWYDWEDRDYSRMDALVARNVTGSDWVFCDDGAYYPAKRLAQEVITQPGTRPWADARTFGTDGKSRITVLIVRPSRLQQVASIIGGTWVPTGDGFTPARSNSSPVYWLSSRTFDLGFAAIPNYEMQVYRRAGAASTRPTSVAR